MMHRRPARSVLSDMARPDAWQTMNSGYQVEGTV